MEREVGGGIGMGTTCKPMAVSFQCMTKSTKNKKKKKKKKEINKDIAILFFFNIMLLLKECDKSQCTYIDLQDIQLSEIDKLKSSRYIMNSFLL